MRPNRANRPVPAAEPDLIVDPARRNVDTRCRRRRNADADALGWRSDGKHLVLSAAIVSREEQHTAGSGLGAPQPAVGAVQLGRDDLAGEAARTVEEEHAESAVLQRGHRERALP